MARVVVVGASGHIGNATARALLDAGHAVVAAARRPSSRALEGLDLERAAVDVLEPEGLRRVAAGADALVFAAGAPLVGPTAARDHPEAPRTHVDGAVHAAEAARAAGARFVFCSSSVLFDDPARGVDETAPLRAEGRNAYERAKLAAEAALDELALDDEVRVYPTGCIGPFDFGPSELGGALRSLWRGRLPAVVAGAYDFVDVRDVAAAIAAAAVRPAARGRYLLGGELLEARELFAAAARVGRTWRRPALPWSLAATAARALDGLARVSRLHVPLTWDAVMTLRDAPRFDCARARAELDYDPRDMRTETLPDTRAFFVELGEVPA